MVNDNTADGGGTPVIGRQSRVLGQLVHDVGHGGLVDTAAALVVLQQRGQAGDLSFQLGVLGRELGDLRLKLGDLAAQSLHFLLQGRYLGGLLLQLGNALLEFF